MEISENRWSTSVLSFPPSLLVLDLLLGYLKCDEFPLIYNFISGQPA